VNRNRRCFIIDRRALPLCDELTEMTDASHHTRRRLLAALAALTLTGCVYRVDVQQGNLLDEEDIDSVQAGMTRSQVRFLLGTPVVEDSFQHDRWDYVYYFRRGSSNREEKRWLIVWFDGDKVKEMQRDVPFAGQ
jgi:outer membrane protein assembly factor BamE